MRQFILVGLVLLLASCADEEVPERLQEQGGGPAVCEEGPEAPTYTVESVGATGPAANVLAEFDETIWVVESQQNTVSTFDPNDGVQRAIDVGEGANPYDLLVENDRVFVTNYLAGNAREYTRSGELTQTFEGSLKNPAGVAWDGTRLWVSDVNYISPEEGFGPARLELFADDGTSLASQELDAENLQFLSVEVIDGEPYVFAVATGAIEFVEGVAKATSSATVFRWPADVAAEDLGQPEVATLEISEPAFAAALGRLERKPGTELAYFTSGASPNIYVLDLSTMQWARGLEDPIELYESDENALHHGTFDQRGIFYVTAFNQDAMYLVDTRCDEVLQGPMNLGISEELLEGPHGVVARDAEAFFVMSVANSLGRVRFEW